MRLFKILFKVSREGACGANHNCASYWALSQGKRTCNYKQPNTNEIGTYGKDIYEIYNMQIILMGKFDFRKKIMGEILIDKMACDLKDYHLMVPKEKSKYNYLYKETTISQLLVVECGNNKI